MANGRPPGDGSDRSPRRRRGRGREPRGVGRARAPDALGGEPGERGQRVGPEGPRRAASTRRAPGTGRSRRSGKPKWSAGKKTVVVLVSVIVLAGGRRRRRLRLPVVPLQPDQQGPHQPTRWRRRAARPFTILVIGSDTRVGESAPAAQPFGSSSVVTGQRSDVVQLWRVTPSTKQIQIMSIPRDTVVTMLPPDNSQYGTYNRINSSYNSGANQLVKTITANFGIPINHVVQVDFSGFQDAVNALGGIYLNFPYPAKDAYSGLNITTPGCQLLNGAQALAVARARHYEYYANGYWQYDGTSDFGRIQRQDVFIKAMIDRGQVEGEPAHRQRVHRLHPRGRDDRRRLRLQRAHRAGPDLPLLRPGQPAGSDPAHRGRQRLRRPGRRADGGPAGRPADAGRTSSAPAWRRRPTRRPTSTGCPRRRPRHADDRRRRAPPTTAAGAAATTTPTTAPPPSFNPRPAARPRRHHGPRAVCARGPSATARARPICIRAVLRAETEARRSIRSQPTSARDRSAASVPRPSPRRRR